MANSENLLSTDEIAALTAQIESGSVEVDTGFNTGVRARKHDLTNEDSSLGVNVSSLDMINERFIRLFRLGVLESLRTSPRINPTRVQLKKFGDYLKDKQPPMSVNVIRMQPLRGTSLVLIDPNVVFSSLDHFFGGMGKGVSNLPPGRLFTMTESRIINILLAVFFRSLKEAWAPLCALEFETVSTEINPNFAQIADQNDLVIVNHFEADCGDAKGFIDLVYPYASLKPIRELLRSRVQAVDAHDESDRQWTHDLTAAIGDAGLTMQVELAEIQTTLGRFNAMKPGDVLYFKKPELARAIINEIPIFEVEVGSAGPMVAVKAQKAVELKLD